MVLGSPSVVTASIASVKVALTLTPGAICVAPMAGLVLMTLSGVVSTVTKLIVNVPTLWGKRTGQPARLASPPRWPTQQP
jgi:hypothetical protein